MTLQEILTIKRVPWRKSPSNPDEIALNCPFCPERRGLPDTNFCFHVNTRNGAGHCWHKDCDWKSGKAARFLARYFMGSDADYQSEAGEKVDKDPEELSLPEDFKRLWKIHDDLDQAAYAYIRGRKIPHQQIVRTRMGVSYVGRYAYRVVIPIWVGKDLRGLIARDFTQRQTPKYLLNTGPKYLFNFSPKAETLILSEGVFKALRIEQYANPESCSAALLGHALTDQQAEQITRSSCKRVILWSDPDRAGRKGTVDVADKLCELGKEVQYIFPVPEIPPDELSGKMLAEALRSPLPYRSSADRRRLLICPYLKTKRASS